LVFTHQCFSQAGIRFRELSCNDALATAAQENKPVFVLCYESTCGHCEKMMQEIFPDSALAAFYNEHFICIRQEATSAEGRKLAGTYSVSSYPTYVITNAQGDALYQFCGEYKAEDFIHHGLQALLTENQLPYLKERAENNLHDSVACYKYILALNRGRLPTQNAAEKYFAANKEHFEIHSGNWKILSAGVSDIRSEPFQFIVEHQDTFALVVGRKKVERKLYVTCAYCLQTSANANDTVRYFANREAALQLQKHAVDSLVFMLDLSVYEKNNQAAKYLERAFDGAALYVWHDAGHLRRIAERFVDACVRWQEGDT